MSEMAKHIAHSAHFGQKRRDGLTAYICHPRAVAERLQAQCEDDDVIDAAWLHDVIEDSPDYNADRLRQLGVREAVVVAVELLTKKVGESYEDYLDKIRFNPIALKVKEADMLHNLSDDPTPRQVLKYARGLVRLLG